MTFLPRPGRFEEVLAAAKHPANEDPKPDRFTVTAWIDGWAVWDRGVRISTFAGTDPGPAQRHKKRLQEDAAR